MTITEEFADWMQEITVQPLAGEGAWGPVQGDPVPVLAYWNFENRVVVSSDGKTATSSAQVYCSTEYAGSIAEGARVTLPGNAYVYTVLAIRSWPEPDSQLEVSLA